MSATAKNFLHDFIRFDFNRIEQLAYPQWWRWGNERTNERHLLLIHIYFDSTHIYMKQYIHIQLQDDAFI